MTWYFSVFFFSIPLQSKACCKSGQHFKAKGTSFVLNSAATDTQCFTGTQHAGKGSVQG